MSPVALGVIINRRIPYTAPHLMQIESHAGRADRLGRRKIEMQPHREIPAIQRRLEVRRRFASHRPDGRGVGAREVKIIVEVRRTARRRVVIPRRTPKFILRIPIPNSERPQGRKFRPQRRNDHSEKTNKQTEAHARRLPLAWDDVHARDSSYSVFESLVTKHSATSLSAPVLRRFRASPGPRKAPEGWSIDSLHSPCRAAFGCLSPLRSGSKTPSALECPQSHSPFGIQASSLLTSAFAAELTGIPQKSKKGPRFLLAILE